MENSKHILLRAALLSTQFIFAIAFSIWFSAQLLTINWTEHNDSANSAELKGILRSLKQLREEYENRKRAFATWEPNSIGASLSTRISVHLKSK